MAFSNGTKVKIKVSAKGEADHRRFFKPKTDEAKVGEVMQTLGDGRILVLFPEHGTLKCDERCLVRARDKAGKLIG